MERSLSLIFTVSAHLLLSHVSPIDSFSHAIRRLPPSIEKGLQGKNTVEFRIPRDGNIQKDELSERRLRSAIYQRIFRSRSSCCE